MGQLDDGAEPGFASSPFQAGDFGRVQIAGVTERFLGQRSPFALAFDVVTKDLLGLRHAGDRAGYYAKSSRAKTSSFR